MKKWLSLFLSIVLLLAAAAPLAHAEETVSFTDSAGRTVEVPANITRIANSGNLTQIFLFALAPEYFVGLASKWTPEAEEFMGDYYELPVLGNLYGGTSDLNLEEIAAQDPQLIIDVGEAKSTIVEDMDALQEQIGIPAIHIDAAISTNADAYRTLGALLGLPERGEELATYCEEVYARTQAIIEAVGEAGKKDMLFCVGEDGLNVVAKGSYHGEIFDIVANNLAVIEDFTSKGTGDPIDMEQLLLWDPEYIIFAPGGAYAQVQDDPLWNELRAIREGKFAEAPSMPYSWVSGAATVQRYLGMIWLCDMFYPEACEYDLQEEVAKYFSLFYHAELTQEQFDRMMQNARVQ